MFFDKFYNLCAAQRTTVSEVIKELGLSAGSATKWKNGAIPKLETRMRIANKLNVPIEALMTDNEISLAAEQQKILENAHDVIYGIVDDFLKNEDAKNKLTTDEGDELTEDEKDFLAIVRQLSPEGRAALKDFALYQAKK